MSAKRKKPDTYLIANGLTLAMFQVKGLADLINHSEMTGRLNFPREVESAIDAIRIIASQAVKDYARHL